MNRTLDLIKRNTAAVEAVAKALVARDKLTQDDVRAVLAGMSVDDQASL